MALINVQLIMKQTTRGVKKGSIKLWKNDQSILIVILSEAKILLFQSLETFHFI
jgi:hypothetical protein